MNSVLGRGYDVNDVNYLYGKDMRNEINAIALVRGGAAALEIVPVTKAATVGGKAVVKGAVNVANKVSFPVIGKINGYDNVTFIYRYDNDFSALKNAKGNLKAHIDQNGDLVPANINGKGNIETHVRGSSSKESPYISFTAPEYSGDLKDYGKYKIAIDIKRLEKDIKNNKLPNTEIICHKELTEYLNGRLAEAKAKYINNPIGKNKYKLKRSWQDLSNSKRDGECLIKGCIPSNYIIKEK